MNTGESTPSKLTERQRLYLEHIQAAESSGMSLRAYADAHGLDVRRVYSAKRVLAGKGALPRAVQAVSLRRAEISERSTPSPGGGLQSCRVYLPNGVMLEFDGPEPIALGELLQAAGSLS